MSEEDKLIGKTIIKAEILELYEHGYSKEPISKGQYDDEPILRLTMSDGSIFEIEASYGGYSGNSLDEYPAFISVKDLAKESELGGGK